VIKKTFINREVSFLYKFLLNH